MSARGSTLLASLIAAAVLAPVARADAPAGTPTRALAEEGSLYQRRAGRLLVESDRAANEGRSLERDASRSLRRAEHGADAVGETGRGNVASEQGVEVQGGARHDGRTTADQAP